MIEDNNESELSSERDRNEYFTSNEAIMLVYYTSIFTALVVAIVLWNYRYFIPIIVLNQGFCILITGKAVTKKRTIKGIKAYIISLLLIAGCIYILYSIPNWK